MHFASHEAVCRSVTLRLTNLLANDSLFDGSVNLTPVGRIAISNAIDLIRELVSWCPKKPIEVEAKTAGSEADMTALQTQVGGNHYREMAIQPIEFCHRNKLGPCESAVIKYVCRHLQKNGKEDLQKAIHKLELLIQLEYPDE